MQPDLQPEPLDDVGGDDAEGDPEAVGDRRDEVHPLPGLVVVLRRHLLMKIGSLFVLLCTDLSKSWQCLLIEQSVLVI